VSFRDDAGAARRGSSAVTIDNHVMWNVLSGTRLFDIPVYRVSPAQFRQEQQRQYERYVGTDEPTESWAQRWRELVHEETGSYQFNQVMGWVQVIWDGPGPVIKCYYVRVASRRVTRLFRQRHFEEVGKIAEEWFPQSATAAEIAERVRTALLRETRGRCGALRGRFLDLEIYDNLSPVLDLRALLGLGRVPDFPTV
jgi:hypothetical protein